MDHKEAENGTREATRQLLVRLPEGVLSDLRKAASREQASVNSVVVGIVRRYLSWGRFQQKLGFMPLHKSMVVAMLDKLAPEEAENIGVMQKDQTIRDFLLFSSGYSLESFVGWIGLRCEMLGFQLLLKQEAGATLVVIHHGMGHKWSAYYKGLFGAVLKELLPEKAQAIAFTATDSLFSLEIPTH